LCEPVLFYQCKNLEYGIISTYKSVLTTSVLTQERDSNHTAVGYYENLPVFAYVIFWLRPIPTFQTWLRNVKDSEVTRSYVDTATRPTALFLDHIFQGCIYITGATPPWRLSFVRWRPIFVRPQYGTCCLSPFWHVEFSGGPNICGKIFTLIYFLCPELCMKSRHIREVHWIACVAEKTSSAAVPHVTARVYLRVFKIVSNRQFFTHLFIYFQVRLVKNSLGKTALGEGVYVIYV
jgi:hypothetical protein